MLFRSHASRWLAKFQRQSPIRLVIDTKGSVMAKFRITRNVESASGFQTYTCDAKTKEDALRLFQQGKGEFEFEEVEITELSPAELDDIEDIDE